jgi:hypothetical protein
MEARGSGLGWLAACLWSGAVLTAGMAIGCGSEAVVDPNASAGSGAGGAPADCGTDCACPEDAPEPDTSCQVDAAEVCLYPDTMGCSALYGCRSEAGTTPRWTFLGGAIDGSTCWCGRCDTDDEAVDTCSADDRCYEAACGDVVVTLCRRSP